MPDNKRGTVSFNKQPEDVSAARRAARERMAQAKAGGKPLGFVEKPPIPRLDADTLDRGGTMADQAKTLNDPTSPLSPKYDPELAKMSTHKSQTFRTLPQEAASDPRHMKGVGSMIAKNQPHLTDEDGEYRPGLSPETKEMMEHLGEFAGTAEKVQKRAARESFKEDVDEEEDRVEKEIKDEGARIEADIKHFLPQEEFDVLNNSERRKEIESRCQPLNISDIITHGEIRQRVPIRPGKLVVNFRSLSGAEDLAIKSLMWEQKGSERYTLDKFSWYQLTLAVVDINGEPLPDHMQNGKFNEKIFLKKFDMLMKFPIQLLGDLGLNNFWFDQRVKRLFLTQAEALKNI